MASAQITESEPVSGRLLTRNWVLNLLGWVVPLSVALFAIPYVVRGLGAERFGVLSIASALLGYFGIFDLGTAMAFVQTLGEGVYVAMNGRCFPWDGVRKDKKRGIFERVPGLGRSEERRV